MIPIRLSTNAANYIRRETEYLRQRNPVAARNFSLAIKNAKRMLQSFPESGNRMHGLQIAGNRTLVAGDYLLDYSFDGSVVEVTSIRHGRMLMPAPDIDIDDDLGEDFGDLSDTKPTP
jgi:plasmid stabilization system protein ParE